MDTPPIWTLWFMIISFPLVGWLLISQIHSGGDGGKNCAVVTGVTICN